MSKTRPEKKLKALGASAKVNRKYYHRKGPDPSLLEAFLAPQCTGTLTVHVEAPEFTSRCPLTGQPDFATIVLDYQPNQKILESKSWKLFLTSFRDHGCFHEQIVADICDALVDLLDPIWLEVEGKFTPRGGIPFHPTATYKKSY